MAKYLVAFDVRNAFNSLRWDVIHTELKNRNAPGYLRKIMKGYLSDQWVRLHLAKDPPNTGWRWGSHRDRSLGRPCETWCMIVYSRDLWALGVK